MVLQRLLINILIISWLFEVNLSLQQSKLLTTITFAAVGTPADLLMICGSLVYLHTVENNALQFLSV